MPLLSVLRGFKGIRGKWFDPFGRTEERRSERAFIGTVERLMDQVASKASGETLAAAEALLEATAHVRGFGPVKARNLAEFEAKLPDLLKAMDAGSSASDKAAA